MLLVETDANSPVNGKKFVSQCKRIRNVLITLSIIINSMLMTPAWTMIHLAMLMDVQQSHWDIISPLLLQVLMSKIHRSTDPTSTEIVGRHLPV